jgi:hypothetical protein
MKNMQTITAVVLIATGILMSFIGFWTPPKGEISDSVLWYFAQTLIYAGSVFGLKVYVDRRINPGTIDTIGDSAADTGMTTGITSSADSADNASSGPPGRR